MSAGPTPALAAPSGQDGQSDHSQAAAASPAGVAVTAAGPPARPLTSAPDNMRPVGISTLFRYWERISRREDNSIEFWQDFVSSFYGPASFAQDSIVMKLALWNSHYGENRTFELSATLLARFYKVIFDSGVVDVLFAMEFAKEYYSTGMMFVDCPRAAIIYRFDSDIEVHCKGHLRVSLSASGRIHLWEFHTKQHTELLSRAAIEARMRKADPGTPFTLPPSPVNEFGITINMMRCLEIAEVVNNLSELMSVSIGSGAGPLSSLHFIAAKFQEHKDAQRARGLAGAQTAAGTAAAGSLGITTPGEVAATASPASTPDAPSGEDRSPSVAAAADAKSKRRRTKESA